MGEAEDHVKSGLWMGPHHRLIYERETDGSTMLGCVGHRENRSQHNFWPKKGDKRCVESRHAGHVLRECKDITYVWIIDISALAELQKFKLGQFWEIAVVRHANNWAHIHSDLQLTTEFYFLHRLHSWLFTTEGGTTTPCRAAAIVQQAYHATSFESSYRVPFPVLRFSSDHGIPLAWCTVFTDDFYRKV